MKTVKQLITKTGWLLPHYPVQIMNKYDEHEWSHGDPEDPIHWTGDKKKADQITKKKRVAGKKPYSDDADFKIEESYISPGGGSKYGNVIFLAGGAGSGKSTAIRKFVDLSNYKIINPDDFKERAVRGAKKGIMSFRQFRSLDPNSPEGSSEIHKKFFDKGSGLRRAASVLDDPSRSELPNYLFDRTFSHAKEFKRMATRMLRLGYKPQNMHIVFVDTPVERAIMQNRMRTRTLPDEVIRASNEGARANVRDFLYKRLRGAAIDGDVWVVRGDDVKRVKQAGRPFNRTSKI